MNHAIVPKSYNPHLFTRCCEHTSRAEHTKYSNVFTETVQDEETDFLKRKLDQLLHETWHDVTGGTHPRQCRKTEVDKLDKRGEPCKRASSTIPTCSDESHTTVFRLLSSTNGPRPISLQPRPLPPIQTREPEWEDSANDAMERKRRAESVAIEYDDQWRVWGPTRDKSRTVEKLQVPGGAFPVPPPSVAVIEKGRTSTRSRPRSGHREAVSSVVQVPCPHEVKVTGVPILPAQTTPVSGTSTARNSRRRRRRKVAHERPAPAYWKPPVSLRGKCMGYALGYPGGWGHADVPGRGYTRDTMKKGVHAWML
ncbi:hypothetical protein BKA83DRAFT_4253630 [Pisolithus microcarpus]|nr:hypothetical protein BKA83DRAFT_4253630 [Pisolithus microcarpus]